MLLGIGGVFAQSYRTGVLANGLHYYLRGDDHEQPYTDMRLALKVGGVHEKPHERGFAHYIEHMAFYSSKRFPDDGIHQLLRNHGILQGGGVNAYTSTDHTVYSLQWPAESVTSLDSGLSVLSEWLGGLQFQQQKVDTERSVIMMEMRGRKGVDTLNSLRLPSLAVQYDAVQLPDEPVKASALDRFYQGHYKPNQAAVFICSPLPIDSLQKKISEQFAPLSSGSISPLRQDFFPKPGVRTLHSPLLERPELSIILPFPGQSGSRLPQQLVKSIRQAMDSLDIQPVYSEVFRSIAGDALLLIGLDIRDSTQLLTAVHSIGCIASGSSSAILKDNGLSGVKASNRELFFREYLEDFLYSNRQGRAVAGIGINLEASGIIQLVPDTNSRLCDERSIKKAWRDGISHPMIFPIPQKEEEPPLPTATRAVDQQRCGEGSGWNIFHFPLTNGTTLLLKQIDGLNESLLTSITPIGYADLPKAEQEAAIDLLSWFFVADMGPFRADTLGDWQLRDGISINAYAEAHRHGYIASCPTAKSTSLFRFIAMGNQYAPLSQESNEFKKIDEHIHRQLWGNSDGAVYILVTDTLAQPDMLGQLFAIMESYPADKDRNHGVHTNKQFSTPDTSHSISHTVAQDGELEFSEFIFQAQMPSCSILDAFYLDLLEDAYFDQLLRTLRSNGLSYSPSVNAHLEYEESDPFFSLQIAVYYLPENAERVEQLVKSSFDSIPRYLDQQFYDVLERKHLPQHQWPYLQSHQWMKKLTWWTQIGQTFPIETIHPDRSSFLHWLTENWSLENFLIKNRHK